MNSIRELWYRLRGTLQGRRHESEMAEEIRHHIEELAERYVENGMTADEALAAARRRFGGVDQLEERCRDIRRMRWVEDALREVHFAVRGLLRRPAFTVAMVAILAIGVGATSAIVNVGRRVMFPAIPYPDPERLVVVIDSNTYGAESEKPYPFFGYSHRLANLRDSSRSFELLGGDRYDSMNLVLKGEPFAARVSWVTDDFFGVLGARAHLGRLFIPGDFKNANGKVAVVSWNCWRDRFGADPKVVGQDILLGGKIRRVVGILPKSFVVPEMFSEGEIYLAESPSPNAPTWPFRFYGVVGRLASGVARRTAQAEMNLLQLPAPSDATKGNGRYFSKLRAKLVPLPAYYNVGEGHLFWVFLAAIGFLYAIVCSNAASLMLTRMIGRRRELGVRMAIGGSRWQVARLLVAEGLVLSLSGGAVGALLAWWCCKASSMLFGFASPFDWVGLAIALALSALTCCLVVVVPVMRLQRAQLNDVLKEGTGSLGDSRRLGRLRACFVVVQAALAVTLLAGAGVMVRSYVRLEHVDMGFELGNKVAISGALPENLTQEAYLGIGNRMREALKALPGVRAVTLSSVAPLSGFASGIACKIEGSPEVAEIQFRYNRVSLEYFSAMGIPIVSGRGFEGLRAGDPPVALINQTAARRFFGSKNPVGKRLDFDKDGKWEIIGVVGDVREMARREEVFPQLYCPLWQPPFSTGTLFEVVQATNLPGPGFDALVRRAAYEVEPRMVVTLSRLSDYASWSIQTERYTMVVLQVLSAVALVLATLGLFAVMAFAVAQQHREFGLRMALGAAPSALLWSVMNRGVRLAAIGIVLGLGASWGLMRFLKSVLFETDPHDPSILAGVAMLLLAVATLACWLPALRASKIDPSAALRSE